MNYNCYYAFLIIDFKIHIKKSTAKLIESNREKTTTPITAKIVLFVFGVGPLILMCLFLFSNGFFSAP